MFEYLTDLIASPFDVADVFLFLRTPRASFLLAVNLLQEHIDLRAVYEREMAKKRAVMSRPGYCELCSKHYKDLGDVRIARRSIYGLHIVYGDS